MQEGQEIEPTGKGTRAEGVRLGLIAGISLALVLARTWPDRSGLDELFPATILALNALVIVVLTTWAVDGTAKIVGSRSRKAPPL